MPSYRCGRLIRAQEGSTLIELLVAMPIAVMLLGLVVQALGEAGTHQQDIERRTEALTQGQIGLERMTREIRQANWVYFRSSSVVDVEAQVRASPTAISAPRLVRYDCSGDGCTRAEGPAAIYPPALAATLGTPRIVVGADAADTKTRDGRIVGHDVFRPTKLNPSTGVAVTDFIAPDYLLVRVQLRMKQREQPVILEDGVSLRNLSTFKG